MNAMSQSLIVGKFLPLNPTAGADIAKQVGQEILENRLEPGTWATALSESGGNRQEALSAYARTRIQQLTTHRRLTTTKVKSFESRRVFQCFGVKTVQDLLQRSNSGESLNFLKPRLSVLSLLTLWIGFSGCVGSAGRLFSKFLPDSLQASLPAVALLSGGVIVALAMTLRFTIPKRCLMLGWNSGLLMACTVVCFGSLLGGVKLISHAAPLPRTEAIHTPAAAPAPTENLVSITPESQLMVSASLSDR
jgi:hypothetical protein